MELVDVESASESEEDSAMRRVIFFVPSGERDWDLVERAEGDSATPAAAFGFGFTSGDRD